MVRKFDLRTLELGEVVAAHPDRDIVEHLLDRRHRYLAGGFVEDRLAYDFADKTFAPHFKGLDGFFKNACNINLIDVSADHSRFLAEVSGPTQKLVRLLFSTTARPSTSTALTYKSPR